MSEKILFNKGWRFHEGEIETSVPAYKGPVYAQAKNERYLRGPASRFYADVPGDFCARAGRLLPREITHENWVAVNLPHDYVISQELKQDRNNALGFFDYHPAWYRKHFTVSEEDKDKRLVLYFEGVSDRCEIYLNGSPLYENLCGYVPFEVDITDFVRFDQDNVLAVHVMPTFSFEGWWYNGGGIYRNVWLEKSNDIAVERYGVYVAPKRLKNDLWLVPLQYEIRNNAFEEKSFRVETKILAPDGTEVAVCNAVGVASSRSVVSLYDQTEIQSPLLWDIETPNLYSAITSVYDDEELLDVSSTTFGFRTIQFTADKGFFLNGKNVKLKGICGHGDFGLMGKVVPDNIHRYKTKLMKEMGVNAYRTAHYPQAEYFMDELDRAGILVMDETRWFSSSPACLEQLRTLIKRDRNHPSVIFWSIGNEENCFLNDYGLRIFRTMKQEVEKLDKTRPIIVANDKSPLECTIYPESDVLGINYNIGLIDPLHEKYPNKPIVFSECCATGSTRGWYYDDANGYINAYDRETNMWYRGREETWKFVAEREWFMGEFQWTGLEYRGEAVWPRICSQSGAIDLYLQKKDAFYQNQSHWTSEPMIHLLPHWNWADRMGEEITVFAYTNCDEAELFLNGDSLGKKTIEPYGHGAWSVVYTPGTLEVVGYKNGKQVAYDKQQTTKAPYALALRADNADDVKANGKDVLLYTCYCVDEDGLEVPNASTFVRFHTNALGTIVGTGSDVCDHTSVTLPERRMRAGAITVAVTLGENEGALKLYAEADGLIPTSLTIDIQK